MNKIRTLLCALFALTLIAGCDKEINNWEVDASHDRLFRPITFEEGKTMATSVLIKYTKVINATDYVFEFSEDSLQFNNIVRVDTILSDTLTPYKTDDSNLTKVEYRTLFTQLKGVSSYSVRMKAINTLTGRESGYVSFFFKTPEEQIFTKAVAEIDKVSLYWEPVLSLTHFTLWERNEKGELINPKEFPLTPEILAANQLTLIKLTGGTGYTVEAYDNETKRGTIQFRTLGIQSGEIVYVQPEDTITHLLEECAARKVTDVSLMFEGGKTYDSGTVKVPGGIENLVFVGKTSSTGALPILVLPSFSLNDPANSISFENVALDGKNGKGEVSSYLFSGSNANCFKSISFKGCKISNYNRCVVRVSAKDLEFDSVTFDDCLIDHVANGGYGFIVFGAEQKRIGLISITNCTFTEMGCLIEQRGGAVKILMDKCTVYNNTFAAGNFFRMEKQPGEVTVTNTIFAGCNNNKPISSGYKDYKAFLSFNTCYRTSDFVEDKNKFTDITPYDGTSEQLFVDPTNGDFHLEPGAKFAGEGKAGDPRWVLPARGSFHAGGSAR